ncbi:putative Hybrid PKS-NRPS biosynthetic cluster [Alternaria triticimaculans]|uniref:putative Hybrid PKS-NRPS biosynthetic cluster n=1 Tax=Alternaria triticimaculans TaxID=297637 RepID=UPI0020C33E9B|nr:putative Hybrid PKS-NRPS biosynthetic cluster [Alternaria triticimaculans]KAI4671892.1 putative Hybrid PKS-NRPS biosynthetic cluster [Alternaria triticimaculans]
MTAHRETSQGNGEPIAVIGSGMRFPGSSNNSSKLWELLLDPRDLLKRIPEDRFNIDNFYHPDPNHHATTDVRESYFLEEDHRHFDAGFFNIKPVEVAAIDPQQRLLMEVVYESLEAAGIPLESLIGSRTGVYVGLMCADYHDHLHKDVDTLPTYAPTGTARSIMSNRISYFFDWHGPCMTIDTACSSSLVAVHQAVQLLRSGDSDVAVAAGVNMILGSGQYIAESSLHMLSADSRSRMWDADASGYARGEGVASVILKRLSTALADGDKIECIIRESGVNQDGRTKGITMPSASAQMDLIEQTYKKAGLDPKDPNQRCQYFEAHGTGTAAGDPKEAEAISKAFFHPGDSTSHSGDPLYVGSIKTVIGHTEGTAGLAGLLKASLAVQHGVIPPNLLFNKLHPAVEPFYTNLEIATSSKPWPNLADGIRRASVNSFGFGGTNAHVIVENFLPPTGIPTPDSTTLATPLFSPFNFSAASSSALRGVLSYFSKYLQSHPTVDLGDLCYTLYARRSHHAIRASMSAKSAEDLQAKIDDLLAASSEGSTGSSFGTRAKELSRPVQILGVFTGQGAQWPTMGKGLMKSPYVRTIVKDLDRELQRLPEPHRPSWTLAEQLTCDASESRVAEAAYAQPLTTTIEIILYDLLRSAGVSFHAIIGHSSGEIAAAYAKGFITRAEAVKIAYYRGYYSTMCPSDKPGAMMAAGASAEDANELCDLPMFKGRLCVAAYNSPTAVTLSGDSDAIEQAREILQDEGKFARVLKVDKAYHSSHMEKVAAGFLEGLKGCNIRPQHDTPGGPSWFSSTYENTEMRGDVQGDCDLSGSYWVNNLLRPVLFSQAVQSVATAKEGQFDFAIEVGPHAALKGPVLETLRVHSDAEALPYVSLLHRGKDDIDTFSNALGDLWSRFSPSPVDFHTMDLSTSGALSRDLLKDLPTYHWEHDRLYWHESRMSRAVASAKNPHNPLLGARTTDVTENEIRWRNLLKLSEMPWVRGHQLQGQVIYPATAYIATAVEAARSLSPDEHIAVIEIQDFSLGKPLVFGDSDAGIETLFTLHNIAKEGGNKSYVASFSYHASNNAEVELLSTHATGKIRVTTGDSHPRWLPSRKGDPPNLTSVSEDRFYSSLEPIGYSYSGDFRTLSSIERRLDYSSSTISVPAQNDEPVKMLLHPAMLDTALQGIFLAYCFPGDGSLQQLHVPTGIKSFRVNVGLCEQHLGAESKSVNSCAHLTENPMTSKQLRGDVDIYTHEGAGLVQMEGIQVVAFAEPTADMDKKFFTEHIWAPLNPDCELAMGGFRSTAEDYEFAEVMERVVLDYMRNITSTFPKDVRQTMNLEWHFECMFEFYHHVISTTGTRPYSQSRWLDDTADDIAALKVKWAHRTELQLARAVGDNLPAVLRGETTILEHMTKDGLLDRFYEVGMGLREWSLFLGQTVKQIVHRYGRMKVLEIGAGTGGATKVIMKEIGRSFASYTYTDISSGFFETAQQVFSAVSDKMIFKTLDCEKDVVAQGYEEHSYDMVVASLVLHATTDLRRTLRNARQLMKPGGYLVMQEITNNDVSRTGFMMSATTGWWLGQNDGRMLSPGVSTLEWHQLLLECGFSGIDTATPEIDVFPSTLTVWVTQAVDDRVSLLREPLSSFSTYKPVDEEEWDLVIIGGQTLGTSQLISQIVRLIQPFGVKHAVYRTLGDMTGSATTTPNSAILCLAELDEPIFRSLSEQALKGIQRLFETQGTVLWVTQGCRSDEPYMNMSIGLIRTVLLEIPDLVAQVLDLESGTKPDPRQLLETLIRLRYGTTWEKNGSIDKMLWTQEHELALENGQFMVARVHHENVINDRYNASKRTIYHAIDPQTTPVNLSLDSTKPALVHNSSLQTRMSMSNRQGVVEDASDVVIKVAYSLLAPVLTAPLQPTYLVLGTNMATAKSVVSITPTNGSHALVHPEDVVEVEVPAGSESQFLSQLDNLLRVENLLSVCRRDSTLLIHEPSPELASSVIEAASLINVTVFFTTSATPVADGAWISIDSYAQKREVRSLLPSAVAMFVNGSKDAQQRQLGEMIASALPDSCLRTTLAGIQALQHARGFAIQDLRPRLHRVVQWAMRDTLLSKPLSSNLAPITLEQLVGGSEIETATPAVLDWNSACPVPVQISTVDGLVHFKSDKTYVMFGLTSDLAQSTCTWMASHGARNIVLTSRSPKMDARWLESMKQDGVRVEVFANDITDKAALSSLVDHIRQNFPPIAGIAHGAMVLDDVSFSEMPLEKMTKVLRPKLCGAIFLDELFRGGADALDFFVFFSSAVTIAGNRGQAAYSAANSFMTALANKRRSQGLAASIFHIGAVMGVGYINRNHGFLGSVHEASFKVGFLLLSEREFHLCFGEAVLASHPLSGRNPEVMTALRTSGLDDVMIRWPRFPRFQHCLQNDQVGDSKSTKRAADASIKSRLVEAATEEEIRDIVQDGFIRKLRVILQIPDDKEASQILTSRIDDLGVDSLVAVEIRSWFLKELQTEVPVFMILSGGLVQELLDHAVANTPARQTPDQGDTSPGPEVMLPDATPLPTPDATDPSPSRTPQTSTDSSSPSHLSDDDLDKQESSSATSGSVADSNEVTKPSFDKILPISPGQSRFWFQKHLMEDQTTANSTICVAVNGTIKLGNLESAVQKVAARHESFRTSFFVDENQRPVQGISETSRLRLETVPLADEAGVARELERLKNHVYDIEHGDCMRIVHLSLTPTKSYLLLGSHHIIMDGISLEVLLDDLQKAYNGQELNVEPAYQYSSYSEKLRGDLASGVMQGEIEYWRSEFAAPPSPLPLLPFSAAKNRVPLAAYAHNSVSRVIDMQLSSQIQDACRERKANLFHFHLGVFEVLLFKLFGNSDVCIGMADANRWDDRVAKSIGMYLNLLPLRFHLENQHSFEEVLKDTRKKAYRAMSHSRLPFDVLLDNVSCERSTAISPLFQAFINYRQGVSEKRRFDSAEAEVKSIDLPGSGYDMSLDIIENPGGETRVTLLVQRGLYSESDASQLLDMYFALLKDLSRSCGMALQDVSLFSSQDVSTAIELGKGPVMASKWPETLAHRIDEMIAKHPDETSVKDSNGMSWTYQQLDQHVGRISSALLKAGTNPGSVVAIFQEPSPHFVFSLLAILRVGAVYVPLDCNIPPARLRVMMEESKCSALLVNTTTAPQSESMELSPSVAVLDVLLLQNGTSSLPPVSARASEPAAILFTSGTSGIPKGVMLSHGSLRNHVEALVHTHGFGRETVLQQSSVGFDMSLNQIFMALANGGTLVIVPEVLRKDPVAVANIVLEEKITYTSATPSEYLAWLRHGAASLFQSTHWAYATAGGEKFLPELLQSFRKLGARFEHEFHYFNAYGPTECAMSSSELDLSLLNHNDGLVPAGRTLPNYGVYIVGQDLSVLPIGWSGEVCIAGAGVAMGYINSSDESQSKFLHDPMPSSVATQNGWTRMYRTGDKGVLRSDGSLEIIGRIDGDTQIKLRGLRIELQDIEQSILDAAKGRVKMVAVTPRGDPALLIAHAVLSPSDNSVESEIQFLGNLAASLDLPQYMRPAAIIAVSSMPLNAAGKVDRRALRGLAIPSTVRGSETTEELTEMESKLVQVWLDTLPEQMQEVHRIDASSDFFHVGGNSMLLIELRQLINKTFKASLPLLKLFENSTLGAMATMMQDVSSDADKPIDWEAETAIPSDLLEGSTHQAPGVAMQNHTSPKTVVISGATGLLGSSLLRLLVQAPDVGKIHCIAIRDISKLAEFASCCKVVLHKGDLSLPRCGLTEAEAKSISASADAIIHNGADVSFLKTYQSLRSANVSSTKELVRLASTRRIPLHFVSTATAGKFNKSETLAPESLARFPPHPDGGAGLANGYAASKWVSEIFLEKASQQIGLPVFIHRPSAIMGDDAAEDIMSNLLEYGSLIKALPDLSRWTGYVDLVSLENVTEGIARSVLQVTTGADSHSRVEYLHHAGDQIIPVQSIRELLSGEAGSGLESLPIGEWVDGAVRSGMNPLVGEFLRDADAHGGLQVGQKLLLSKEN